MTAAAIGLAIANVVAGCGGGSSDGDGSLAPLFGEPIVTEFGSAPHAIRFGDFNRDGKIDVAFALAGVGAYVMLGNGDGTFQPARSVAGVLYVADIAVSDFNGDGKPDLALTACSKSSCAPTDYSLFIALGNGDGTFRAAVEHPVVPGAQYVAIGDFNGDGVADIAVEREHAVISVLLGKGDGTFDAPTDWSADVPGLARPFGILIADFNGDGRKDLVVFHVVSFLFGGGSITVLFGHGDGSFERAGVTGTAVPPGQQAIADFNRDGKPDVAISGGGFYTASGGVQVYPGRGDGTFDLPVPYVFAGSYGPSFAVGDVNRNGDADVVTRDSGAGPLFIWYGKGDGTFADAQAFPLSLDGAYIDKLADLNGDGRLDLALVTSTGFAVLLETR